MPDEPTAPNIVGYFGIIVPTMNYWQGFFLNNQFADGVPPYLQTIRQKIDTRYVPISATVNPVEGVSDADQALVGALSAALVDRALAHDTPWIGLTSVALHQITGFSYFLIVGKQERSSTHTTISNLANAKSAQDVRDVINAHPAVMRSKLALIEALTATFKPLR